MSTIYYLIIEDGISLKQFQRTLVDESTAMFAQNYAAAAQVINSLTFQSDDRLLVVLDNDLGDPLGRNGADLFFMLREKFPDAFIINFSSDPEGFVAAVRRKGWAQETIFNDSITDKNVKGCISLLTRRPSLDTVLKNTRVAELPDSDQIERNRQVVVTRSCCCLWVYFRYQNPGTVVPDDGITLATSSKTPQLFA
jgi:hypothetical protein